MLINIVTELVKSEVPPSDRAIRELLVPIIDELPEQAHLPSGFRLDLREIDRYPACVDDSSPSHHIPKPTGEIAEVGRLLAGRSIVLIGGDRRPEAQNALVSGLGLDELVWIETREHQSVATFEPVSSRPEVVLVLFAIRWSSHAFSEVKNLCDRLGKLLVRLPGGYHPNQVAFQILNQCGERLQNS
ncbi:hypothetical protein [Tautonia rosea]|uniref:hypothetical protein n=1 Tax=Tautonia rosea TaxID=2728037 RepID=UPI0014750751|nr:hypothetical protein [Tautonia rosea]